MHQNDPLIIQSLNELNENPLPATSHVKMYNLSDYPAVTASLQADQYKNFIDKVSYNDDAEPN